MEVNDFILARIGELYCELTIEQRKSRDLQAQLTKAQEAKPAESNPS